MSEGYPPSWIEAVEGFLRELSALTRKYHILIDACGCCQGPYLRELPEHKIEDRKYTIDEGFNSLSWVEEAEEERPVAVTSSPSNRPPFRLSEYEASEEGKEIERS